MFFSHFFIFHIIRSIRFSYKRMPQIENPPRIVSDFYCNVTIAVISAKIGFQKENLRRRKKNGLEWIWRTQIIKSINWNNR